MEPKRKTKSHKKIIDANNVFFDNSYKQQLSINNMKTILTNYGVLNRWSEHSQCIHRHPAELKFFGLNHIIFQQLALTRKCSWAFIFVKQHTKRTTSWTQKDVVTYNSSSLLHGLAVWVTNVMLKVAFHCTRSFWCLQAHSFSNIHCHYKVWPVSVLPNHVINFST